MKKKKITIDENIVDHIKTTSFISVKDLIKEIRYIIGQYLKSNKSTNNLIKALKSNIYYLCEQHDVKDEIIKIVSKDIDFIKNYLNDNTKSTLFELEDIRQYINYHPQVKTAQRNKDSNHHVDSSENAKSSVVNIDLNKRDEQSSLEVDSNGRANINKDSHKKRIDVIGNMNYLNKELNKKIKD